MMFPVPSLVLLAITILSFLAVKIIREAYFTPLNRIPGPWYAKFTNLVLKKHVLTGRRLHYIHELHNVYGPVVRLTPREIDISDPATYHDVHRVGSGFTKDPWYRDFRFGDTEDVFSLIDRGEHTRRRKLFAPLWTNSALHTNWESVVIEKVKLAVSKMKEEAVQGETDVFKWWTFLATDVISHLSFGQDLDMLRLGKKNKYVDDLETSAKVGFVLAELPWLRPILMDLPWKRVQRLVGSTDRVMDYAQVAVVNAKSGNLSKFNMFYNVIRASEKASDGLSVHQCVFEAAGLITAGSGTTAVSLTYLVWAVLNDATAQQLEHLPYLNAVIDETLRLYGAAPGSLPRRPPKGGATLGGFFVPEGTTVSSQAYTLHRNGELYPEPNKFNPSRFIDGNGKYAPAQAAWAPFGAGARICLGQHLARMEMRHAVAEFFRACRSMRIADSMEPAEMDMINFFGISPIGGRCCVTLVPQQGH